MTVPNTISADYTLRPSELASTLALLVEARQPCVVWGPPGAAKSMIAQQVAADANRQYVDVRALLLDPVDLRGIPWRDGADRTRWAPPAFLPPSDDPGLWLINLEELPSGCTHGTGGSLPAGAGPESRRIRAARGRIAHRLRQPRIRPRRRPPDADPARLALRPPRDPRRCRGLVRLGRRQWHRGRGDLLRPARAWTSFITSILSRANVLLRCPRTWHFASNIVQRRNGLDPASERALFRGTIGEARGGRVRGVPEGLARAAPSEGGHQRPRERRHPERTRAR